MKITPIAAFLSLVLTAPIALSAEAICQVEGKVAAVEQLTRPISGLAMNSQQPYTQVKVEITSRSIIEHGNSEADACAPPKDKPVIGVYELPAQATALNVGDTIRAKSQFRFGQFWASTVLFDVENTGKQ